MPCSSPPSRVERARPLLGTLVSVAGVGLPAEAAHPRIDRAFAAIAEVHRLMSFHAPTSEVTRLNQRAARAPVRVAAETYAVLALALEIAAASEGLFDVTVGGRLAASGRLPRPPGAPEPDPAASWREIELCDDRRVRFRRPLWIDLGGVAKGHAVDRAIQALGETDGETGGEARGVRWIVNAGGDLRVAGDGAEAIRLRTDGACSLAPVLELENGSVASSSGRGQGARHSGATTGPHLDPRCGRAVGAESFVAVAAERCAVADALTKVVLAAPDGAGPVLQAYGATAFLNGPAGDWTRLGAEA